MCCRTKFERIRKSIDVSQYFSEKHFNINWGHRFERVTLYWLLVQTIEALYKKKDISDDVLFAFELLIENIEEEE